MLKRAFTGVLACILGVHFIVAQQLDCARWMGQMLTQVDKTCAGLTRNVLCYGNVTLSVTTRDPEVVLDFSQPGDLVGLTDIQSLTLEGLDPAVPEWGIGMMRVQASLEKTLPGQSVTVVLFGDVSVQDAGGALPMHAFYLQTGVGAPSCHAAPESGILIQTPEGVGRVEFDINNAHISLGSTMFVTAPRGGDMTFTLLEGHSTVTVGERQVELVPGSQAVVPLDDAGIVTGDIDADITTEAVIVDLPTVLLPETFELPDLAVVSEPVVRVVDPVTSVFGGVTTTIDNTLGGTVKTVTDLTDSTLETVTSVVDDTLDTVTDVVAPVIDIVPEVVAPVIDIVPTLIPPVVEIVPTLAAPVVEIIPTLVPPVVEIIPTVAAPIVEIIPTLIPPLPTLPPLVPTNVPILGGLLNP